MEHCVLLGGHAVREREDRGRIELVALRELLLLAVEDARVLHLDGVEVVRIEAEDRDARVVLELAFRDRVFDLPPALFRDDADLNLEFVAAVADDRRQRRDLVGIYDHFVDVALNGERYGRPRRAAARCGDAGKGKETRGAKRERRHFELHGSSPFHDACGAGRRR